MVLEILAGHCAQGTWEWAGREPPMDLAAYTEMPTQFTGRTPTLLTEQRPVWEEPTELELRYV